MPLLIKGSHSALPTSLSNYIYSPCSYLQSKLIFFDDFSIVCKWRKPGSLSFTRASSHFSLFPLLYRISQLPGILSTAFTYALPRLLGSTFHFFITGIIKDILYTIFHNCILQVFLASSMGSYTAVKSFLYNFRGVI